MQQSVGLSAQVETGYSLQLVSVSVDFKLTAVVVALERDKVGEAPDSAALVLPANKEGSQLKVRQAVLEVPLTRSPR